MDTLPAPIYSVRWYVDGIVGAFEGLCITGWRRAENVVDVVAVPAMCGYRGAAILLNEHDNFEAMRAYNCVLSVQGPTPQWSAQTDPFTIYSTRGVGGRETR
jgi:hypothetical protein